MSQFVYFNKHLITDRSVCVLLLKLHYLSTNKWAPLLLRFIYTYMYIVPLIMMSTHVYRPQWCTYMYMYILPNDWQKKITFLNSRHAQNDLSIMHDVIRIQCICTLHTECSYTYACTCTCICTIHTHTLLYLHRPSSCISKSTYSVSLDLFAQLLQGMVMTTAPASCRK